MGLLPYVNHPIIRFVIVVLAAGMLTSIFFVIDGFAGYWPFGTQGPFGYFGLGSIPYITVYIISVVLLGILDLTTRTGEKDPQLEALERRR